MSVCSVAFGAYFLEGPEHFVDVVFAIDVCLQFFSGYMKVGYPVRKGGALELC